MELVLTVGRSKLGQAGWAERIGLLLVLLACAVFIFVDFRTVPIELWDESRIAVNALEMHLKAFSLITTYGDQPDLWNTKPPLLVWLITGAMALFGPSELAVRLPSTLAALATLVLVMAFVRRMTCSAPAAALAAVLLSLSLGFFGEHGARTGDYDALLGFFTTAYAYLLFFALHRRRPRAWTVLAAGGLIGCAVLTKSIAGLVPGVGVAAYLLLTNRWGRPLLNFGLYGTAGLLALLPPAAFYLAREAAAPGYLAAVWGNDVSGRFLTALDEHAGAPWYYLDVILFRWWFAAGPLFLFAPLALLGARGKARQALVFTLCCAAGVIAVISLSSTKLPQYAMTAYPFLAMAAAIAVDLGFRRLKTAPVRRLGLMTLVLTLAMAAVNAADHRYRQLPERAFIHQANYGALFQSLARQGVSHVTVADTGVEAIGAPPGYSPQLRFYSLSWAQRGLIVRQVVQLGPVQGAIASCDETYLPRLRLAGADLARTPRCLALKDGRAL